MATFNGLKFVPEVMPFYNGRLYHCDYSSDKIYELDPDTLLPINTVNTPSTYPYGVGGTATRLYHCDITSSNLYELDTDTLLPINTVNTPSTYPTGVGGTKENGTVLTRRIIIQKATYNGLTFNLDSPVIDTISQ